MKSERNKNLKWETNTIHLRLLALLVEHLAPSPGATVWSSVMLLPLKGWMEEGE
jgi:hypothetical protein